MESTNVHRAFLSPKDTYKLPETVNVELAGREYPCSEFIRTERYGNVPVLDIKLMSDEKERELADRQKKLHPELYAEYYAGLKKG